MPDNKSNLHDLGGILELAHTVTAVEAGSIADQCGIKPGDILLTINRIQVMDLIDYQFLCAQEALRIEIKKNDCIIELHLTKDEWEPLGLSFASTMVTRPNACANRCVFCFIDQLPKSMRPSLYIKDDDWRLSLMMGNYITLTNVSDTEMDRIIARHASPLHISIHATDGDIRARMMGNPQAKSILQKLLQLKDAGIAFHCQVVLCPGINDGMILENTINDLASLYPAALSVALVPVGLTAYREGLCALTPYTKASAKQLLAQAHSWQVRFLQSLGTRFLFPADEFYCHSETPIPQEEAYEGYPQIENGVGLLRRFEEEYTYAHQQMIASETIPRRVLIATGVSTAPCLEKLLREKPVDGITVKIKAAPNVFFGESVTVAGLLTGRDIQNALCNEITDEILLPAVMLRQEDDLFLDDMPLTELQHALKTPVHVVETDGAAFLYALQGELYRNETN